jgi:hypothetical protein
MFDVSNSGSSFWRNVVALFPHIDPGPAVLVKGNWAKQEHAISKSKRLKPGNSQLNGMVLPLSGKISFGR